MTHLTLPTCFSSTQTGEEGGERRCRGTRNRSAVVMDWRKEDGRLEEGDFIPGWLEDVKVLAGDEAVASSNVVLVLDLLVRGNQ